MNIAEVHTQNAKVFMTNWNDHTPVDYDDNLDFVEPVDQPWVRIRTVDNLGGQNTLGGSSVLFRYEGFVAVQVFYPLTRVDGSTVINNLVVKIMDIFENPNNASEVWYRNVQARPNTPSDKYIQKNVICEFITDNIKSY